MHAVGRELLMSPSFWAGSGALFIPLSLSRAFRGLVADIGPNDWGSSVFKSRSHWSISI